MIYDSNIQIKPFNFQYPTLAKLFVCCLVMRPGENVKKSKRDTEGYVSLTDLIVNKFFIRAGLSHP